MRFSNALGRITGRVTAAPTLRATNVVIDKEMSQCSEGDHATAFEVASQRLIIDEATRGVANCVVYLAEISEGKDFPEAMQSRNRTWFLDQQRCQYIPHVEIIRTKTQVNVGNGDPTKHNIHGFFQNRSNEAFNYPSSPNSVLEDMPNLLLRQAGKYILTCDLHAWMNGYIWVFDHPYAVVTDAQGHFTIDGIPPGTYELVCWHEPIDAQPELDAQGLIKSYTVGADIEIRRAGIEVKAGEATTLPDDTFVLGN